LTGDFSICFSEHLTGHPINLDFFHTLGGPYSSVDEIRAPFTFASYATLLPLFCMTLAFVLHEAYEKAQTIMLSYGIAVWAL
uniref:hypothetical protein n=1 Tax=Prevotella sp. TaxID=59823 RepID=UPI00402645D7